MIICIIKVVIVVIDVLILGAYVTISIIDFVKGR